MEATTNHEGVKNKLLLMGQSGSGKTSMRTIIFADSVPSNCKNITPTMNDEQLKVKFLGDLYLNLWDCGGQDAFMENYFTGQRDRIFADVAVLIFVVEVRGEQPEQELQWFENGMKALKEYSPNARVFCLIHKMDLVSNFERTAVFEEKKQQLRERAGHRPITCFATSIWDETLYTAWSTICTSLMPGLHLYQTSLDSFLHAVEAREVVLFESKTFLTLAKESRGDSNDDHDPQRCEKVSTIMKHFKITCSKLQSEFKHMEVRNSRFSAYLSPFTHNTLVLVIMDQPVEGALMQCNLKAAQDHFSALHEQLHGAGDDDDDDDDERDLETEDEDGEEDDEFATAGDRGVEESDETYATDSSASAAA